MTKAVTQVKSKCLNCEKAYWLKPINGSGRLSAFCSVWCHNDYDKLHHIDMTNYRQKEAEDYGQDER